MPKPPPPPKAMSSRLSSMKFMQRAAAASRTSSDSQPRTPQTPQSASDPTLPPAKRLRTSFPSTPITTSVPGTSNSALDSVNGVGQGGKNSNASGQRTASAGDEVLETKWEFKWVPEETSTAGMTNGARNTSTGGIQIEEVNSWIWTDEGNSEGGVWPRKKKSSQQPWEGDDSIGRRAFGPLSEKRRRGHGADTSSESGSEDDSDDDENDKGGGERGNMGADAAAMIKKERRAQSKAQKKLEKAAKVISARAIREQKSPKEKVKLSRLTSISAAAGKKKR